MAIKPRSFFNNPLLLVLLVAAGLALVSFTTGPISCPSSKAKADAAPTIVQMDQQPMIRADRSQEPAAVEKQEKKKGWLGVRIQTLNKKRAEYAGVEPTRGVLILELQSGKPAETAGFRPYDVVTHVAGTRVTSACELKKRIEHAKPGTRLPVRVIRSGVPVVLYPTLTSRSTACSR